MMIWIVGGLLVLMAAGLGFGLGAVRSAVSLVGLFVAASFAATVGGWMAGLVPKIGFPNPIWQFYLPPLLGFISVSIVFLIVALLAHHFVHRYYRNNTDEYTYARWTRLNRRSGLAIGVAIGTVWWVLLAMVAYVPGYLATQLADAEESSMSVRLANNLAHGGDTSGLNRLVEHYQPASEEHYVASDILGLVYHNPALHSRLASYPPFLGLAERPEIAELSRDPEVNSMIQSRAGLSQIVEHARIRAVVDNPDIVNELLGLDFADLDGYLRSGVSQKFKDEHILGRWRLNVRRSIAEMKLTPREKLPAVEFNLLRKALNVYLDEMTIGFTTDNRAIVKVKAKDEQKLLQTVGRAAASSPAAAGGGGEGGGGGGQGEAGGGGGLSARALAARAIPQQPPTDPSADLLRQRYGITGGGAGQAQRGQPLAQPLASGTPVMMARAPAKAPTTTALGPLMSNSDGNWRKDGEDYFVTVSKDGTEVPLNIRVRENQLIASHDGRVLVFDRI